MKLQTYVTFGVLNIDAETCRGPEWNAENVVWVAAAISQLFKMKTNEVAENCELATMKFRRVAANLPRFPWVSLVSMSRGRCNNCTEISKLCE